MIMGPIFSSVGKSVRPARNLLSTTTRNSPEIRHPVNPSVGVPHDSIPFVTDIDPIFARARPDPEGVRRARAAERRPIEVQIEPARRLQEMNEAHAFAMAPDLEEQVRVGAVTIEAAAADAEQAVEAVTLLPKPEFRDKMGRAGNIMHIYPRIPGDHSPDIGLIVDYSRSTEAILCHNIQ